MRSLPPLGVLASGLPLRSGPHGSRALSHLAHGLGSSAIRLPGRARRSAPVAPGITSGSRSSTSGLPGCGGRRRLPEVDSATATMLLRSAWRRAGLAGNTAKGARPAGPFRELRLRGTLLLAPLIGAPFRPCGPLGSLIFSNVPGRPHSAQLLPFLWSPLRPAQGDRCPAPQAQTSLEPGPSRPLRVRASCPTTASGRRSHLAVVKMAPVSSCRTQSPLFPYVPLWSSRMSSYLAPARLLFPGSS